MPVANRPPLPVCTLDLENLRASGLTDATIMAAELRTENGALVFPYPALNGNMNCFARKRPHDPRLDKDGDPIKYEQPQGTPSRAYFPPASLARLNDGVSPVYITEGEKKALALSQLGLAAVGIGGIWCGCKKGTTDLIDDLVAVYWTDRLVYIVFDSDVKDSTRRDVERARRRLAGALRRAGAKVVHLHLPGGKEKVGVDDFIVAHGHAAFFKLVENEENKARTQFTAAELMMMDLPEPCCLVEGIITDGCNILVSPPKLGKSWFALQLAIATATGGRFLDRDIEEGDVLYLALEDNKRRLKKRLATLLGDTQAPKRLTVATSWPRMDEGGKEALQRWIEEANNPKLVIVDTLAKVKKRTKKGADRYADDYQDLGEFKELADDYEVVILVIHHDRKAQGGDLLDEVSGTKGITGSVDTILQLKRERGQHDACLHITGRDIDESELALGWDADACRWSLLGPADISRMSGQRQEILKALQGGAKTIKQVALATGMKEGNTKQLLHQMRKADQVKSNGGVYALVPRPFAPRPGGSDNPDNPITAAPDGTSGDMGEHP